VWMCGQPHLSQPKEVQRKKLSNSQKKETTWGEGPAEKRGEISKVRICDGQCTKLKKTTHPLAQKNPTSPTPKLGGSAKGGQWGEIRISCGKGSAGGGASLSLPLLRTKSAGNPLVFGNSQPSKKIIPNRGWEKGKL